MNIERITELRDNLIRLKERNAFFDLNHWGYGEGCGFAGCVVGWAAHENWWKKYGLEIKLKKRNSFMLFPIVTAAPGEFVATEAQESGLPLSIEGAIADVLGISASSLWRIIFPQYYKGEADLDAVIARIDMLLEHGEIDFAERVAKSLA